MNLSNIVIVLVHPDESRNVGAACRAMANNGISKLRIVGKSADFDESHVLTLAVHADHIWKNVTFYDSVTEATKDCSLSAGTTHRRGKKRKGKLYLPEEFARIAAGVAGSAPSSASEPDSAGGLVAVVFGNERTGLTDEELLECTTGVTIPSDPAQPSLNLSHAVQILCYHLFRCDESISPGYTPLPLSRIDRTVTRICDSLRDIGFFTLNGRPDMERFWRMLLSRSALSEGEAAYLEKTFDKAAGLAKKAAAGAREESVPQSPSSAPSS